LVITLRNEFSMKMRDQLPANAGKAKARAIIKISFFSLAAYIPEIRIKVVKTSMRRRMLIRPSMNGRRVNRRNKEISNKENLPTLILVRVRYKFLIMFGLRALSPFWNTCYKKQLPEYVHLSFLKVKLRIHSYSNGEPVS